MSKPIVFIGMETSGVFRRAFQALGHETYSGDNLPSEDGGEDMVYSADNLPLGRHLVGDVYDTLDNLWANDLWPALAIFHPDCTWLTGSAEWAFGDGPYHQKVKPETLVGADRRRARQESLDGVRRLMNLPILRKVLENPVGAISTSIRKPTQITQPYEFGDDASKKTCWWYVDEDGNECRDMIVPADPAARCAGRMVNGVERWSNQTDSGQNKLRPGADRWKERSRTYPGFPRAAAQRWSAILTGCLDDYLAVV